MNKFAVVLSRKQKFLVQKNVALRFHCHISWTDWLIVVRKDKLKMT